jgi:hypothetical protein
MTPEVLLLFGRLGGTQVSLGAKTVYLRVNKEKGNVYLNDFITVRLKLQITSLRS